MSNFSNNLNDEFRKSFNKLEDALYKYLHIKEYRKFYTLVELASKKNYVIRNNEKTIKHLADLRNLIVHNDGVEDFVKSTEAALIVLNEITDKFMKPKKVYDIVRNKVDKFSPDSNIIEVLSVIKEMDYSQFPVYSEENYIGLLTNNSISRWISKNVHNGEIIMDLNETKIIDVLKCNEEIDRAQFVSKNIDIYTFFDNYLGKDQLNSVFIITENGKKTEKPLSIVTSYDISKIVSNM